MDLPIGQAFRQQIASVHQRLSAVSDNESLARLREGGWSKREILGHLIDSALNNHQRFVRASLDGSYAGPSYQQQGWVNMHGYGSMEWPVLLDHWRAQNELLCEVVDRIPEDRLNAECRIGDSAPMTLQALVEDYLSHLEGHVGQIVG
jgi:DinB superfamily